MVLDIKERLYLGSILPESGSFLENMIIDSVSKKVSFSDDELNNIQLRSTKSGGVEWDQTKAAPITVDFNVSEKDMLKNVYEKMDKEKKIQRDMMSLFIKIKKELEC